MCVLARQSSTESWEIAVGDCRAWRGLFLAYKERLGTQGPRPGRQKTHELRRTMALEMPLLMVGELFGRRDHASTKAAEESGDSARRALRSRRARPIAAISRPVAASWRRRSLRARALSLRWPRSARSVPPLWASMDQAHAFFRCRLRSAVERQTKPFRLFRVRELAGRGGSGSEAPPRLNPRPFFYTETLQNI